MANSAITDEATPLLADTVYAHISVDAASVKAEGGVLTYTVSLKDSSGNAVVVPAGNSVAVAVNWTGVAAAGVDTSALPASVTVSGGTSSTNFTVTATDDYLKEGSESLIATITGVTDTDSRYGSGRDW